LYALDREEEARVLVHWKGIKQLPRLLQLLAHTYTWGERWLEANPPHATDDQQDLMRGRKSTSQDLNVLLYEYLNPIRYKRIFSKLGDSSQSRTLSKLALDCFRDIAKKCDTAAPIPLDHTERKVLTEFLEMTMDRLRNPRTTRDLDICLIVPGTKDTYADPADQSTELFCYEVGQYMYQLFKTFHMYFRIKFQLLAVLDTPACEERWGWRGEDYAELLEPGNIIVKKKDVGDFEVKLGSIMRADFERLSID
jgi:hypothetical protein